MDKWQYGYIAARSRVTSFGCTPSRHLEVPVPAGRRCSRLGFKVGEAALAPREAIYVGLGRSSRAEVVDAKAGRGSAVLARGNFTEQ